MDLDEIKRGLRAEIKKRENEQYFTFQCNVRQMCKDVLAKLEEQESEIAELKQKLHDAEMQADLAECAVTEYKIDYDKLNDKNRRLKRALWIARAELCRRFDVDRYLRNHRNSWYNENCLTWADACVAMEVKRCKAESKCRAKAEEYK